MSKIKSFKKIIQELTGSGAQGVTNSTVVVEDTKHSNAPLWMDNPGNLSVQ